MLLRMAGSKERRRRKRGNKWAFTIGLLIIIFALVGIFTLGGAGIDEIKKIINKDTQKEEYENFLISVVMFDPDPFDDVRSANLDQLLESALWEVLRNSDDPNQYESDDGMLMIPKKDVEKEFANLFGTDVTVEHKTVEGYGYEFEYDNSNGTYKIPLTGIEPLYTPKVVNINTKGDSIILTVGYLSNSQWEQDEDGNLVEPSPDKYMDITLRTKDNKKYVSAIQNSDESIVATTGKTEAAAAAPEKTTAEPETSVNDEDET